DRLEAFLVVDSHSCFLSNSPSNWPSSSKAASSESSSGDFFLRQLPKGDFERERFFLSLGGGPVIGCRSSAHKNKQTLKKKSEDEKDKRIDVDSPSKPPAPKMLATTYCLERNETPSPPKGSRAVRESGSHSLAKRQHGSCEGGGCRAASLSISSCCRCRSCSSSRALISFSSN
ncbi:unnamed protein product, partial [Ixodes pacificus]